MELAIGRKVSTRIQPVSPAKGIRNRLSTTTP